MKRLVAETPTQETENPQETTATEAKEPAEGFSSADIDEITEDLGVEEEAPAEFSGTEEPSPGTPKSATDAAPASADIISLEQREKDAKDLFYSILCGSFDVANNRLSRGQPEGPYKSLDLKGYGEVSRAGSDQFFDRLCDVPMIKRWLFKLNENALMEKWGAIMMLAYSVQSNFRAEHTERLKERSLRRQREDDALKEKPLKEKAA